MFRASRAFRFSGQRKTWKLHWKDVIFAHGVVTLKDISSVKSPNKTSWVRKGWMLTWKHHLTVWWTYLVSYRYLVTFLNHLGHLGFQAGGGATGASAAFWAILTLQNATVENCWCAKDVNVQIWQIETNWIQLINIWLHIYIYIHIYTYINIYIHTFGALWLKSMWCFGESKMPMACICRSKELLYFNMYIYIYIYAYKNAYINTFPYVHTHVYIY